MSSSHRWSRSLLEDVAYDGTYKVLASSSKASLASTLLESSAKANFSNYNDTIGFLFSKLAPPLTAVHRKVSCRCRCTVKNCPVQEVNG